MSFTKLRTSSLRRQQLRLPSAYDPESKPPDVQAQPGKPNPFLIPPQNVEPAWLLGIDLSVYVYLSTSPTGDIFSCIWTKGWRSSDDADLPRFSWENITFGDWNEKRVADLDISLPQVRIIKYLG